MNKKKIGIITFHNSHNCGSILQAYALQTIIENEIGIKNEIIDFSNEGQKRYYSVIVQPKNLKDVLKNAVYGLFYKRLNRHKNNYIKYINNIFKLSNDSYSETKELEGIEDNYDILICGSDQVWNTKCVDADDAYFLSFAKNTKKIAYATSLGANNIVGKDKEIENHYRKLLSDFSAISVRENNGKKWISKLYDKDVVITADPTLLLDKKDWIKLCKERIYNYDYIFFYSFGYDDEYCHVVKNISKKTGMPVIVLDGKMWVKRALFRYGFKLTEESGPDIFLTLIRDAKLVLTTSLHGTIFSTIFEKNFWYINKNVNPDENSDDRAISLLTQLALTHRYLRSDELLKKDIFEKIDYTKSKENVKKLREYSINFLKDNLKD